MLLTLFHNNKNISHLMSDLSSSPRVIDLTQGEILIGFNKPLMNLYVEMEDRAVIPDGEEDAVFVDDEIELKLFNGTDFVSVSNLADHTEGLTRSGFVSWDNSGHAKSSLNSIEAYWLKLTTKTPAQVNVRGINLVLSNDSDLTGFFPNLKDHLPPGMSSFIGFHQEARNRIVQYIRNSGQVIRDHDKLETKQVDQFDLLQIDEFKQASKYLALKLIYQWLSRDDNDKWEDKMREAQEDYVLSLNTRLMTIDLNNNGKIDSAENSAIQVIRITNA